MLCLWNNLAKHIKICQIFRIRKPTYVLYKVFWLFSSEVFRNVEIWPYCLLIFIKKIQVFLKQNFVICIRFYKKHFFKEKNFWICTGLTLPILYRVSSLLLHPIYYQNRQFHKIHTAAKNNKVIQFPELLLP